MCRGSLEDPRPKPSTTNTLLPSNAEQIIRDELYWFPKSAHIQNIRGSNHPKRAFKDSLRTFAYAVLQTTAEFVHAGNVPDEWYSDDDDDDDSDDNTENDDNSENTGNEQTDNEQTDDDNYENNTENEETDNQDHQDNQDNQDHQDQHVHHIHLDEAHVNRTRGVNPNTRMNVRLRSSSRRSYFDLRDLL
jgi:cobalamin biosynthesis protein CobT